MLIEMGVWAAIEIENSRYVTSAKLSTDKDTIIQWVIDCIIDDPVYAEIPIKDIREALLKHGNTVDLVDVYDFTYHIFRLDVSECSYKSCDKAVESCGSAIMDMIADGD